MPKAAARIARSSRSRGEGRAPAERGPRRCSAPVRSRSGTLGSPPSSLAASRQPLRLAAAAERAQRALAVLGRELAQRRPAAGAQATPGEVDAARGGRRARRPAPRSPLGRRQRRDRHDRHVAASRRAAAPAPRSRRARMAASPRSAFVTTSTSGTSMIPAFRNWSTSPEAGCTTTATVSHTSSTSVSDWPTPTVSTTTTSNAAASAWAASRVAAARPPSRAPAAVERIRMPSSRGSCSIRARSPSSEPPERFEDGSTASTATVRPRAAPLAHERRQQRSTCPRRAAR